MLKSVAVSIRRPGWSTSPELRNADSASGTGSTSHGAPRTALMGVPTVRTHVLAKPGPPAASGSPSPSTTRPVPGTAAPDSGAGRGRRPLGDNGPVNDLTDPAGEDDPRVPLLRETAFGTVRLLPDVDRPHAWLLTVDGAPQSYVDLADPGCLEFEYVRRLAFAVDAAAPPDRPLDVLHLGGGALTLPRYVAAARPGSRQVVVEADGGLTALVTRHLPLPDGARITVRTADAREALAAEPAARHDLVVADVFGGDRVPAHLTTLEYLRLAARVLRPGGSYLANLADGAPFAFLRSQLATLAEVFPHVCLLAEPGVLRGRRFGNAVVVAGHTEPPVAVLARRAAADPFPARVEHGAALRRFTGSARPVRDGAASGSPAPPPGAFTLR